MSKESEVKCSLQRSLLSFTEVLALQGRPEARRNAQIRVVFYIVFYTLCRAPMERTDEHDVLMLRKMVVSDVFSLKKGSVSRGDAWDSIAEKLNEIDVPQPRIKDKRGVRECWVLRKLSRGTADEDQLTTSGLKRCARQLVDF